MVGTAGCPGGGCKPTSSCDDLARAAELREEVADELFDGRAGGVHQRVGRGQVERRRSRGCRSGPGRRRGRTTGRRASSSWMPTRTASTRTAGVPAAGRSSTTGSVPPSERPRCAHSASRGSAVVEPPPRSASSRSAIACDAVGAAAEVGPRRWGSSRRRPDGPGCVCARRRRTRRHRRRPRRRRPVGGDRRARGSGRPARRTTRPGSAASASTPSSQAVMARTPMVASCSTGSGGIGGARPEPEQGGQRLRTSPVADAAWARTRPSTRSSAMSSSSSRRLRLRSRSRGVPPGSWSAPSLQPDRRVVVVARPSARRRETAIEPRWNVVGCGRGAVEVERAGRRRIRPPRWPRSSTGSGGAALPRADLEERDVEPALGGRPGLSAGGRRGAQLDAETDDDRRLLRLEHDGDREVGVVVGDDRQAHPALVVGSRPSRRRARSSRNETSAWRCVVVGQHGAEPGRGVAEPARVGRAVLHDPERGGEVAQHAEVGGGDASLQQRTEADGGRTGTTSRPSVVGGDAPGDQLVAAVVAAGDAARSSWPARRACPRPTRRAASAHRSTTAAGPCGRLAAAANMPAPRSGEPTASATSATPCPDWSQRTGMENRMAPVVVFTSILAGSMLSSSPPSDQITSVTLLASLCPRARPAAPGVSLRRVARSSRIGSRCWPGGNGLGRRHEDLLLLQTHHLADDVRWPLERREVDGGSGIRGRAALDARFESTHSCPSVLRAPSNGNRATGPCQGTPGGEGRLQGFWSAICTSSVRSADQNASDRRAASWAGDGAGAQGGSMSTGSRSAAASALRKAAQTSGRSRPRSGTASPCRRAHARTSAVVGAGGGTAPANGRAAASGRGAAVLVVVGDGGAEEPVGPLLGQRPGLGEHDRHGREAGGGLAETVGDGGRSDVRRA